MNSGKRQTQRNEDSWKCLLLPTETIEWQLDNRLLHRYQRQKCFKILNIITNQESKNKIKKFLRAASQRRWIGRSRPIWWSLRQQI